MTTLYSSESKNKKVSCFDTLTENTFSKKIFRDAMKISQDKKEKTCLKEDSKNEYESYIEAVGFNLAHTLTWFKQLDLSLNLLLDFDCSQRTDTGADYFLYNAGNYIIRINSSYDKILQVINAVFHLGISDRNVNEGTITNNLRVKRYIEISSALKNVKAKLRKYSQIRNDLIHKNSSLSDPALERLEMLYIPEMAEAMKDKYMDFDFEEYRSMHVRVQIEKKKVEFANVHEELATLLNKLLALCDVEYELQKKRLQII